MTPRDSAYWARVNRKAASLNPAMRRDVLDAFRIIRDSLSDAELEQLITSGQFDQIVDDALIDRATIGLRERLVATVQQGFRSAIAQLPKQGKVGGEVGVAFDTLNPRVIDAVRTLDTRVVNELRDNVLETIRAHVENALRNGQNPRVIAKDLRQMVGIGPTQATWVEKYRAKLDAQGATGIDKKVAAYTRKIVNRNAEAVSRTATLDSLKLGQKLSWDDAVAKGIVDPNHLWKRWVATLDDRVRDEHRAMNGEEVRYDNYFSNGEMTPGESTYNCRCVALYIIRREPSVAAA